MKEFKDIKSKLELKIKLKAIGLEEKNIKRNDDVIIDLFSNTI